MRGFKLKKAACVVLCVLLFCVAPAAAQEATLKDIIVTNNRDDLLIYLDVDGAFTDKMQKAVLSGVPTTFSFFINLLRGRNLWFDKKITSIKVTHKIKYDNLKKEFFVERSWESGQVHVTNSFEEAQELMSSIDSLTITPLSRLEKGGQYQIRAKAELSKLTLPFYLHNIFFFVSLWDFKTDWYTIDFIY